MSEQQPKRGQNSFMRRYDELMIKPGFNLRIPTDEAIEEKMHSIIAKGVLTDFQVYHDKETGKYCVIEGHTRYMGIGRAIREGLLPESFLIPCKSAKVTSDIELNYLMLGANNGVPLPPLSKAEGYQRAINYGQSVKDISQNLGVSENHIKECLLLLNANSGLQQKIKTHQVSATLVAKKLKEQSSDAIEAEIEQAQRQTGKNKVTKKDLPKAPVKAKTKQSKIGQEITKEQQFRTWLNFQGLQYKFIISKFNEIFS